MTLANDGTFLAEAEYGPERQVMDGRYRFANGQLTIMTDDGTREYACSVDGDTMVVSHDGESVKMARMAGCGSACGGCPDGQCKKGGSCPPDCKKPCCANKKTCSADCTKPCCADKK
ncbi:MAG: hypothetical protein KDA32_10050 [Phycisphaerales bacterium]|nr:hypothetical protein [Phycisphaerales bacterium]